MVRALQSHTAEGVGPLHDAHGQAVGEHSSMGTYNDGTLLTPGEVARLFRVDPRTVNHWAAIKRLPSIRTPGGHRRFRLDDIRSLLEVPEQPV